MDNFEQNGYQILHQILDLKSITLLKEKINQYTKNETAYGVRDLHLKIKAIADLAASNLIKDILQRFTKEKEFQLIKAIFFNKNTQHNWSVPWHQDKTIAVKEKGIFPGFKNWTVKQGIPHVQPPLNILEKIITIRISLDDADNKNGALKVIPRSHKLNVLNQTEIDRITCQQFIQSCNLKAGDILVMHPLLLHSSNKSISSNQRRTIHLEYSSCNLPFGLAWCD